MAQNKLLNWNKIEKQTSKEEEKFKGLLCLLFHRLYKKKNPVALPRQQYRNNWKVIEWVIYFVVASLQLTIGSLQNKWQEFLSSKPEQQLAFLQPVLKDGQSFTEIETASITGCGLSFFKFFVYGSKDRNSLISNYTPGPGATEKNLIPTVTILVLFSTESNN